MPKSSNQSFNELLCPNLETNYNTSKLQQISKIESPLAKKEVIFSENLNSLFPEANKVFKDEPIEDNIKK